MPAPTASSRTVVEEPPIFVETQRFLPRPLSLAALLAMGALAAWVLLSRVPRDPEWLPAMVAAAAAALLYLQELRVTVGASRIEVHFRPLRRRRIEPAEVRTCEARTYRPILEYGGWGLRRGWKGGWAYNVRGNRGAQLVLGSGERLLIGSLRADELARAIRQVAGLPDPRS